MLSDNCYNCDRLVPSVSRKIMDFSQNSHHLGAKSPTPRPRGLVSEIVQTLTDDIRASRLSVGEKLPTEAELMLRFNVSRPVIRQAIAHLQAASLVKTRHGIGSFVQETLAPTFRISPQDLATVADVVALLELRISLETEAAGLAAQRRLSVNLANMALSLSEFRTNIVNSTDTVASDYRFHREIAIATQNRHFSDLLTYLGTSIIPRARVNTADAAPEGRVAYLERAYSEHESIYNAIKAQDVESARAAMRTHLVSARERLRRSQTQEESTPPANLSVS
jgi:GntR family transcriptional regulator, transcriptional repressor for pyruvate dehydrogenase complex